MADRIPDDTGDGLTGATDPTGTTADTAGTTDPTGSTGTVAERVPTVVADGVHITYTVHGTRSGRGSATSALSRIVSRRGTPG
ncbi:hypothetical protein AB0H70_24165, partial [Streptomyces sp. NPDC050804]